MTLTVQLHSSPFYFCFLPFAVGSHKSFFIYFRQLRLALPASLLLYNLLCPFIISLDIFLNYLSTSSLCFAIYLYTKARLLLSCPTPKQLDRVLSFVCSLLFLSSLFAFVRRIQPHYYGFPDY